MICKTIMACYKFLKVKCVSILQAELQTNFQSRFKHSIFHCHCFLSFVKHKRRSLAEWFNRFVFQRWFQKAIVHAFMEYFYVTFMVFWQHKSVLLILFYFFIHRGKTVEWWWQPQSFICAYANIDQAKLFKFIYYQYLSLHSFGPVHKCILKAAQVAFKLHFKPIEMNQQ